MMSPEMRAFLAYVMTDYTQKEIDEMIEAGGPAMIADALTTPEDDDDRLELQLAQEIRENRQEAEQIIAGCLGMM